MGFERQHEALAPLGESGRLDHATAQDHHLAGFRVKLGRRPRGVDQREQRPRAHKPQRAADAG